MSEHTARNFMRVAEQFGKTRNVLDLPATVLYQLAAPSTPEHVREEFLREAEAKGGASPEMLAKLRQQLKDAKLATENARRAFDRVLAWAER